MKYIIKVFISSTYDDLVDERRAVIEAVGKLQYQHDSMEFFGARANRPIEICLDEVRQSDVVLLILGHQYGSTVPGLDISFTEAEYNEAYRLKKPCLVYLRSENIPVLPKYIERDPERFRLLEKLKATLRDRHTLAYFHDAHDLSLSVVADLSRTAQVLNETELEEGSIRQKIISKYTSSLRKRFYEQLIVEIRQTLEIHNSYKLVRHEESYYIRLASGPPEEFRFYNYSYGDAAFIRSKSIDVKSYEANFLRVNNENIAISEVNTDREAHRLKISEGEVIIEFKSVRYLRTESALIWRVGRFARHLEFNFWKSKELEYSFLPIGGVFSGELEEENIINSVKIESADLSFPDQGWVIQWYPQEDDTDNSVKYI